MRYCLRSFPLKFLTGEYMSRLFLVRHGQASFFEDDYDKLSVIGERQSVELAKYWINEGLHFDRVYTGTLKRQTRTAAVMAETYRAAGHSWPEPRVLPGLNEYPADEVMGTLLPTMCEKEERFRALKEDYDAADNEKDRYRTFHRLLEAIMAVWVSGDVESNGLMSWTEFSDNVRGALHEVMSVKESGLDIAVVSSGGPIGVSVQSTLEAPDIKAAELNWRIHNCSYTQFTFSGARVALDTFNAIPHLTRPELLTFR